MLQLEMGIEPEEGGTLLLLDNQSAIKLAKNPVFNKRSKHIAIKYHFIREKVENKELNFEFVRTLSMAADQMTKHVGMKILGVGKTLMWSKAINNSLRTRFVLNRVDFVIRELI